MQKLWLKTMLTEFFDAKGIIHHVFVPGNQTVNGKFYKEVIKKLNARVHRARPEFQESGSWYLLPDIAPAHSLGVVPEFLAKRGILVLSHPPYSPDLAPADFFPKLKIAKKRTRFEDVSSIQQTVTRELKAIWEETFSRTFDSLYERCKRCAEVGGVMVLINTFYLFCMVFYGLSSGTYFSHCI
jgi:histone-lysine N-methyltransferase SETMAR